MRKGPSGVASFIITNEQLQQNRGCYFPMQAMLPESFPFLLVEWQWQGIRSLIVLVIWDHVLYDVYIWKDSTAHA